MLARPLALLLPAVVPSMLGCGPAEHEAAKEPVVALELLRDVPPDQAQRLEKYNEVFLKRAGYFAVRHRIVAVDLAVLDAARKLSLRPFPDVRPIVLTHDWTNTSYGGVRYWHGQYAETSDTTFVLEAWTEEATGTVTKAVTSAVTLPADFWSFEGAVHDFDDSTTYEIKPLQFTPRYSVVFELPGNRPVLNPIDTLGQLPPYITEEARLSGERHREAMDALPNEDDKPLLAEAP